jgi:hypothetical protein
MRSRFRVPTAYAVGYVVPSLAGLRSGGASSQRGSSRISHGDFSVEVVSPLRGSMPCRFRVPTAYAVGYVVSSLTGLGSWLSRMRGVRESPTVIFRLRLCRPPGLDAVSFPGSHRLRGGLRCFVPDGTGIVAFANAGSSRISDGVYSVEFVSPLRGLMRCYFRVSHRLRGGLRCFVPDGAGIVAFANAGSSRIPNGDFSVEIVSPLRGWMRCYIWVPTAYAVGYVVSSLTGLRWWAFANAGEFEDLPRCLLCGIIIGSPSRAPANRDRGDTRLSDAAKMAPTQRPAIAPTKSVAVRQKARKQRGQEYYQFPCAVNCRRQSSASHSIDDVVDANAIRERRSAFGILGTVGPFPCVADIGIVTDGDRDANFQSTSLRLVP